MNTPQRLTLSQLTTRISNALDEAFLGSVWVAAEVSELNENRTGHCYIELVEKDLSGSQLKARIRGTIWARDYRMLRTYFESVAGRRLSAGIKVLVMCHVNFHPVYGLSLNIVDIDPTYTLGDIELQRQETIQKLVSEGIFDMNRALELPILPKRIAIVSSPTAAGYQDFIHQLEGNPYGYTMERGLFDATVQGDGAEESIVAALDGVFRGDVRWDLVAIIRGGGSLTDLACFDSYYLASHIAQFPIPIITGIGHEKDTTIADMVAHTRLKTPTAAAEFIIARFVEAEGLLHDTIKIFNQSAQELIGKQRQRLSSLQGQMVPAALKLSSSQLLNIMMLKMQINDLTRRIFTREENYHMGVCRGVSVAAAHHVKDQMQRIATYTQRVSAAHKQSVTYELSRIDSLLRTLNGLDPTKVLNRGYSITIHNGRWLTNPNSVKPGDEVETILAEGRMRSKRV